MLWLWYFVDAMDTMDVMDAMDVIDVMNAMGCCRMLWTVIDAMDVY